MLHHEDPNLKVPVYSFWQRVLLMFGVEPASKKEPLPNDPESIQIRKTLPKHSVSELLLKYFLFWIV